MSDCISRRLVLDELNKMMGRYLTEDFVEVLVDLSINVEAIPSVTPTDMTFRVIDKRTRKPPIFDHNHIFKEKWFKDSHLIYCDIDCWCISECGDLMLVDDCGNIGYPPTNRFEVVFEPTERTGHWVRISMDKYTQHAQYYYKCSECGEDVIGEHKFCPNCGARMEDEG